MESGIARGIQRFHWVVREVGVGVAGVAIKERCPTPRISRDEFMQGPAGFEDCMIG